MVDKSSNLFYKCAAEFVHLSPQEEDCTSSPWGDSKMYTPGTNNKFTEGANWNKQKWCYSKSKDFSGTIDIVRYLE